jgi:ATP-dependent helicase/nuclease subunit A
MTYDPATQAQILAADPATSTWLSANAGSGKTRVLTNRVAWLLLNGTPPERVLCLTYTKAAAGEMQNRLFEQLGTWAMTPDADLTEQLHKMGVPAVTPEQLNHARTLFARAIETPGGLKIQTIHAFCASLLRRFPLEAGVSPQFTEMDDRAGTLLAADTLEEMVATPEGEAQFDAVAAFLTDTDTDALCADIIRARERLKDPVPAADIYAAFGVTEDPDLPLSVLTPDVLDGFSQLRDAVATQSSKTMLALREVIQPLDMTRPGWAVLDGLQRAMLTQGMEPRATPVTKHVLAQLDDDLVPMLQEAALEALHMQQRQRTSAQTVALRAFSAPYLARIALRKSARGWLDFEDLIQKTRNLLSRSDVAQWVLFKLDGGIDHILVDEAQDTSPTQWEVITALAAEFASGEGARADVDRTIFVVGDRKQSIYSFQGAEPERFDDMRDAFAARLAAVNAPFQSRDLVYSFRSSPTILQLVDATCGQGRAPGTGVDVTHAAFFAEKPGRVDLWPPIDKVETEEEDRDWSDPVDRPARNHHHALMAERVAEQIHTMLTDGTCITVGDETRPVRAGDIIVLLQRRKALFHNIIRACKARELPLAGADVLRISGELAVRDLTALLQFLATPEDDLALACVLRSPLFGWTEDAIFRLAHGRGRQFLWERLRSEYDGTDTVAVLHDLRDTADFLRPYDLLDRVLVRHAGRRNLMARLGTECEEALDALLQQAIAFERSEVPSLTGFLGWLDAEEIKIKRQMDSRADLIRVMSIHGAKGLESPVVILPECEKIGYTDRDRFMDGPGGLLVWKPRAADQPPEIKAQAEARKAAALAEKDRLLYVAMTRAESWLIAGAAGDVGTDPDDSWFGMIERGMQDCGAAPLIVEGGAGLRLQSGAWPVDPGAITCPVRGQRVPLDPVFTTDAPQGAARVTPRSPSDLGGAKALAGEGTALSEEMAMRRGTLLHVLLEHLPAVPVPDRAKVGAYLIAKDSAGLSMDTLIAEACATIAAHPAVFAPDTLAEVVVTAPPLPGDTVPLTGVIDRLIVTPDSITVIDFKSNAVVPDTPSAVPVGLLRQMAAYVHAVQPLYPDTPVRAAILWTATATLMPLPPDLVTLAGHPTTGG